MTNIKQKRILSVLDAVRLWESNRNNFV